MESYTEEESLKCLNSPNKTERLAHVKYLLNKKILNKTVNTQPTTVIIEPKNAVTNIKPANFMVPEKQKITLKPPIATYGKSAPIVKTPDDVSRLLHFDTSNRCSGTSTETSAAPVHKILNFSNKMSTHHNPGSKKRVEYKPATFKESFQNFVKQQNKRNLNYNNQAYIPQAHPNTENIKQINRIVAVTPVICKSESHALAGQISFPEVSPLKSPFPTTSLTCDTPLPTISTFKTCFPLNSQTEIFGQFQQSTTFSNFATTSNSSTLESDNNLIVLEDKVLTQEEKIDIAALGLSKQNIEVPRIEFKQPALPVKPRNVEFSNEIILSESTSRDGKSKSILQIQDIEFLPIQDTQIIKIIDRNLVDDKVLTPNFANKSEEFFETKELDTCEGKKDEESQVYKNVKYDEKSIPGNELLPLNTDSINNIIILDSVKINNIVCPEILEQENRINIENTIDYFDEKSTLTILSCQENSTDSYKSKGKPSIEFASSKENEVESAIASPNQIESELSIYLKDDSTSQIENNNKSPLNHDSSSNPSKTNACDKMSSKANSDDKSELFRDDKTSMEHKNVELQRNLMSRQSNLNKNEELNININSDSELEFLEDTTSNEKNKNTSAFNRDSCSRNSDESENLDISINSDDELTGVDFINSLTSVAVGITAAEMKLAASFVMDDADTDILLSPKTDNVESSMSLHETSDENAVITKDVNEESYENMKPIGEKYEKFLKDDVKRCVTQEEISESVKELHVVNVTESEKVSEKITTTTEVILQNKYLIDLNSNNADTSSDVRSFVPVKISNKSESVKTGYEILKEGDVEIEKDYIDNVSSQIIESIYHGRDLKVSNLRDSLSNDILTTEVTNEHIIIVDKSIEADNLLSKDDDVDVSEYKADACIYLTSEIMFQCEDNKNVNPENALETRKSSEKVSNAFESIADVSQSNTAGSNLLKNDDKSTNEDITHIVPSIKNKSSDCGLENFTISEKISNEFAFSTVVGETVEKVVSPLEKVGNDYKCIDQAYLNEEIRRNHMQPSISNLQESNNKNVLNKIDSDSKNNITEITDIELPNKESNDNFEKIDEKALIETTTTKNSSTETSVSKRPSRLKKGKINLVQRKKVSTQPKLVPTKLAIERAPPGTEIISTDVLNKFDVLSSNADIDVKEIIDTSIHELKENSSQIEIHVEIERSTSDEEIISADVLNKLDVQSTDVDNDFKEIKDAPQKNIYGFKENFLQNETHAEIERSTSDEEIISADVPNKLDVISTDVDNDFKEIKDAPQKNIYAFKENSLQNELHAGIERSTSDEEIITADVPNKLDVLSTDLDNDFKEIKDAPQKNIYGFKENSLQNELHASGRKSSAEKKSLILNAIKDPPKQILAAAQNPFKCIDKKKPGICSLLKNLENTETSNSNINFKSNISLNESEVNTTEKETVQKAQVELSTTAHLETLDQGKDNGKVFSFVSEIVSEKPSNESAHIINELITENKPILLNEHKNKKEMYSNCDLNNAHVGFEYQNMVKEHLKKDCNTSNQTKDVHLKIEKDNISTNLIRGLHKTIECESIALSEKNLMQDQMESKERHIDFKNLKSEALENNESSKQNFKRSYFESFSVNVDEVHNSSDDLSLKKFEKKSRIDRTYVSSDDNSLNDETAFEYTSQRQFLIRNRKRLRKTAEQLSKHITSVVSESDDDKESRDDDDFLGFEELSVYSESVNKRSDIINNSLYDNLVLKDLKKVCTSKKVQTPQKANMNLVPKSNISIHKKMKKRWELQQQPSSETDITDDTSPADDECDDNLNIKTKHQTQNIITNHFQTDPILNLDSVVKGTPVTNLVIQELLDSNHQKQNFESTNPFCQSLNLKLNNLKDVDMDFENFELCKSEENKKSGAELNGIPVISDAKVIECVNNLNESDYAQNNTGNNKVVSCNENSESHIEDCTKNSILKDNIYSELMIKDDGEIKKKRGRKRKYIETSDRICIVDVSKNSLQKQTMDTVKNDHKPTTEKMIPIPTSESVDTSASYSVFKSVAEIVSDQPKLVPTSIEKSISDKCLDSKSVSMGETTSSTNTTTEIQLLNVDNNKTLPFIGAHPDTLKEDDRKESEISDKSVRMNSSQTICTTNTVTKKKCGRPKLNSTKKDITPKKITDASNLHSNKIVIISEDKDSVSNSEIDISDKSKIDITSIENLQNPLHTTFAIAGESNNDENITDMSKLDHSFKKENETSLISSVMNLSRSKCDLNVATKKKRGRPKLTSIQDETTPTDNYIPNNNLGIKEQKKRGRRSKVLADEDPSCNSVRTNNEDNETSIEVAHQSQLFNPSPTSSYIPNESPIVEQKKKRGRPSKVFLRNDALKNEGDISAEFETQGEPFNPRLLLIRHRDELESEKVLTEPEDPNTVATTQCGLCLGNTTKKNWVKHLCEHYGVGWIQGENRINVRSRSIVMSTMINFYKKESIQALKCRMCSRAYRSALGLLMHIEVCGLNSVRVSCEFCNKECTKFTLIVHLRSCSRRFGERSPSKEKEKEKEIEKEEVFNNVGRVKRTSLMKAEKKLKAIGEEFKNSALEMDENNFKNYFKYELSLKEHEEILANAFNKLDVVKCPAKTCHSILEREQIKEHLSVCQLLSKSGYHCLMCTNVLLATKEEAIKHLISLHKNDLKLDFEDDGSNCSVKSGEEPSDDDDCSSGVNSDESNDEEGSAKSITLSVRRFQSKERKTPRIILNKRVYPQRCSDPTELVKRKWKQFTSKNFNKSPLYINASPSYSISSETNIRNRLLSSETSMKFAVSDKHTFTSALGTMEHDEWMELKRFESTNFHNEHLIYIGGPIKMIAWVPLPKQVQEQYFAVIYRKSMEKFSRYQNTKVNPTFILIYQMKQNATIIEAKLHYAINVSEGPVHCLSFLPSGGYDETTNRLGLLAVGSVKNEINIYSLPLKLTADPDSEFKIIDLKPYFVLCDNHPDNESSNEDLIKTQCLQICWSKAIGHNHIFASFHNGCIGIWDINTDENVNINSFQKNGLNMFVPLNYFFVGETIVNALDVHYDTNGPRWLAAACARRKLIVFDIRDLTQPIILKEENLKNLIRSLDWPIVWETVNVGLCDTLPGYGCTAVAVSPINICYSNCRIDSMLCGIGQIHYNPNINIQVCGSDNGDIVFLNVRELHLDDILLKTLQNSRAVAAMDLKCLNNTIIPKCINTEWQLHEKDYKNRYGVVFGPILKYKPENKTSYLNKERIPKLNLLRYTQINSIRWNINPNCSKFLAVGYENGFLRLINFNKKAYFHQ
ncbi:uncharacterized protein LOC119668654 isoform X2 [Teleopsis dalmanni]|nr:uncharacterized protein LOC119668654 isoform X2 [Teleopsis dalmanni]